MWLRGGLYDEWARFLERWAEGDDAGMGTLPDIDPALLQADTLDRLVRRIVDALSQRLQAWADALVRDLSSAGDEFSAGRALTQARAGLRNIRLLARHPGLPEPLRDRLLELVDGQVRSMQESLEDQLTRSAGVNDRPAVEARRRALRENALIAVLAEPAAPAGAERDDWFVDPALPPRRRVVTGRPPTAIRFR